MDSAPKTKKIMNWQRIRIKQPKANKLFETWMKNLSSEPFALEDGYTFKTRDLYDFFDQNGVRLFVMPDFYDEEKVQFVSEKSGYSKKSYETRIDAEYAAFEKGFELLEKKLK